MIGEPDEQAPVPGGGQQSRSAQDARQRERQVGGTGGRLPGRVGGMEPGFELGERPFFLWGESHVVNLPISA